MHFPTSIFSILSLFTLFVNGQGNATDNGIGSTPKMRYVVSAAQALAVITAGRTAALKIVPQNIAVVDPTGLLIAFLHMDDAYYGSIDISQKKARTSVLFNGVPSAALYNSTLPTGDLYGLEETNGGLVVFGGGLPLYYQGHLVGAVGVSGGTVAQDVEVATAAVAGLPTS